MATVFESLGRFLGRRTKKIGDPFESTDSYLVAIQRLLKMTRAGLEPATYGLKVRCSTN
jgi:hypothetical protein